MSDRTTAARQRPGRACLLRQHRAGAIPHPHQGLLPAAAELESLLRCSRPEPPPSRATAATACRRNQILRVAPDNGPGRGRAGTAHVHGGAAREAGTADRPTAGSDCNGSAPPPYRRPASQHDRPSDFGRGFVRRPAPPPAGRMAEHRPLGAPVRHAAGSPASSLARQPEGGLPAQPQSSPRSRVDKTAASVSEGGFDARFHPYQLPFS
jgi:hypothetical protein